MQNHYTCKNIATIKMLIIFSSVLIAINLLISLLSGLGNYLVVLIWLATLFVPEFLAIFYFINKKKRTLFKPERKYVSLSSAAIRMLIAFIHSILSSTDNPFKETSVIYFLTSFIGGLVILWVVEYSVYYAIENIVKNNSNFKKDDMQKQE